MKAACVVIALVASPLLADDVHLRGGGRITGEIVEQSRDSVTVDVGGGRLTVRMASVVRIEKGVSPLQEYRARAGRLAAGDAEGWRGLARWATGQALATQADEAWTRVVAVLPTDPEANRALGREQLDGRWVTEEESFRARGFVELEGEWMTPGERERILHDRQAREAADRQEEAERMQAEDRAERGREAKEAAETEAFLRGGMPRGSDIVYWGWGTGPSLWPQAPVAQPGEPR